MNVPMIDAKHLASDGKRFQLMKKLAKQMLDQLRELMADDAAVKSLAGSERPGHKYISRKPKAKGYEYVYRDGSGKTQRNTGDTWKQPDSLLDGFTKKEIAELSLGTDLRKVMAKHGASRVLGAMREIGLAQDVGRTGLYMEEGQPKDKNGMLAGIPATIVDEQIKLVPFISTAGASPIAVYTLKLQDGRTVETSPFSMRNFVDSDYSREHPAVSWALNGKPVTKSVAGSERPGHKYIRREPKAGGGHKYVYTQPLPGHDIGKTTVDADYARHLNSVFPLDADFDGYTGYWGSPEEWDVQRNQHEQRWPLPKGQAWDYKTTNWGKYRWKTAARRVSVKEPVPKSGTSVPGTGTTRSAELDKFASIEMDNMPNNAWIARRPDGSTIRKHEDKVHSYRHSTREGAEKTRLKAYKASQEPAAKPETKKPHEMDYDEFKKAYPAKRAVPRGYFHPSFAGTMYHTWSNASAATHAAYEHVVEQALAEQALAEGQTVPDSVLQATIVGQHYIAAHTPVEKLRPWTDHSYLNASKPGSSTSATPETADALRAQGYTISRVEYHKFDRDKMPQNIGDQTHTIPLRSHGNQQAYKKGGTWFYHHSDGNWYASSENTRADLEYLIQHGVDVPADLRSQHYLGGI